MDEYRRRMEASEIVATKRYRVRKLRREDAAGLYLVLSDPEVMRYIEPPFSMQKTEEFIEECGLCEKPLVYGLAEKETDRVIGHVIFHSYGDDTCFELGWIIGKSYWGQNTAQEVTEGLIRTAEEMGIKSLVMECIPEQEATKHLAEIFGFAYTGMDGGCRVYRRRPLT